MTITTPYIERECRYRHKKTGGIYMVSELAALQIDVQGYDMQPAVVYVGEDGRVWVRPESEFRDRFEVFK